MVPLSDLALYIIEPYNNYYARSDTANERLQLDLGTPAGSLCAVAQAIMYAFPTAPHYAEDAVAAILEQSDYPSWYNVEVLSEQYDRLFHLPYRTRLREVQKVSPRLYKLVDQHYKRIPNLITLNILKAAKMIEQHSNSDISQLYAISGYDGRKTIQTMMSWGVRLQIKAFWVAREMRIQKVWVNKRQEPIAGEYCCVVDIQVERALGCLGVLDENTDLFEKSKLVWSAFGGYYDLPLLWLARTYCSRRGRMLCPMRARGLCGG